MSPKFSKQMIDTIVEETIGHVSQWRMLATEEEVPISLIDEVEANLRLNI